jgi:hypothetical protein
MIITGHSDISVWLDRHFESLENPDMKEPVKRSMPYADVRVAEIFDDDDDIIFEDDTSVEDLAKELKDVYKVPFEQMQKDWEKANRERNTPLIDVANPPRARAIPAGAKNRMNKKIHSFTKGLQVGVRIDEMFEAIKEEGAIPIQEDGTPWAGMLIGGGECGSDQAREQRASIELVIEVDDVFFPATSMLHLTWCQSPSGKYEVVAYVG